jgi:hypothetical protein
MPQNNVKASGITDIIRPKIKDESISPTIIVPIATGRDKSISRVFERVSQGTIEGPTAVAVKNVVMPISPGKVSLSGMFRPI